MSMFSRNLHNDNLNSVNFLIIYYKVLEYEQLIRSKLNSAIEYPGIESIGES